MKKKVMGLFCSMMLCTPLWAAELTVATAAGYRKPLTEVFNAFTESTGIQIDSAFGNIQQIKAQARQNPNIQILIGDWFFIEPMKLAQEHVVIGQGKLVLVSPKDNPLSSLNDLLNDSVKKIAIADRKNAIYGKAAMECFTEQGLLKDIEPKLLEVTTLPQVSTYVVTNEVDAGFVNLSEAQAHQDKLGPPIEMPQSCYRAIDLSAAPITGRSNTSEANAFLQFLNTKQARVILMRHGL